NFHPAETDFEEVGSQPLESTSTSLPDVPIGPGQVRVLALQESGVPTSTSYGRLLTPFPELRSFTVCYRIRLNRFREESTVMSYAVSDDKDNELRMDHQVMGLKVTLHSKWALTTLQTPIGSWAHFCFLYRFLTGEWNIFQDGELRAHGTFPITDTPLLGNGVYIIGQEQDSMGGGFQRDQCFSGEITELNFWDTELSNHTIKRVSKCEEEVEDATLKWSLQEWQLAGEARSLLLQRKNLFCPSSNRLFVFFPDRMSLSEALHLCQIVGGIVAVPQNEEENSLIYLSTQKWAENCSGQLGASYMWLGANDNKIENKWVYWGSGEPIPKQGVWRGKGPNGGTVENCLVMLYGYFQGEWSDIACLETYAFCAVCEMENNQVMYLKGPAVCKDSPFDIQYVSGNERGGRISLKGFYHSDIFWDVENSTWVLQSLKVKGAVAWWTPMHSGLYPFGTNTWRLGADVCNIQAGHTVNLTLSVCGSGMFTCSSGTCISLYKRCDLNVDCPDQSDEAECSLVDIPSGYSITLPPPPIDQQNVLPIYFTINILSFTSINTEDLAIVTAFELKMRWKDPRLKYLNLKEDRSLNVLSSVSVSRIWTPQVFFSNARGNVFSNLDQGSRVECIQEGMSVTGGPHLSEEMNIFSGWENSLELSQLYSVTYSCDFNLIMFPFDAQVCTMSFRLVSASATHMTLIPQQPNYTGLINLVEYSIGEVSITSTKDEQFSSVAVQVRFARRYGFYLLTLYIPTVLLIFIAYATFFFNPDDFNSRITVCLTALLEVVTLYARTSNSLPKTSYFKLVDVWLFFSIVIMFIIVMLQTHIDFSRQKCFDDNSKFVTYFRNIYTCYSKIAKKLRNASESTSVKDYNPNASIQIRVRSLEEREDSVPTPQTGRWMSDSKGSPAEQGECDVGQRVPKYHRAIRRQNWANNPDVNMPLMEKSRIWILIIFMIFNLAYWGAVLRYVICFQKGTMRRLTCKTDFFRLLHRRDGSVKN
ncbi:uncharacterized protein, partial [Cherax quadricarinatus]|uniref:uncharacterized protein n=1 Tax=Cherax quadricarinatus TaxID=27406 RepID=UPI00387EE82E